MKILGIETSCDDTGVAIYDSTKGLLVHKLASQVKLHQEYGGVVPELAARDHIRTLLPLIDYVLCSHDNPSKKIDGIAYTAGPGLISALLVGATVGNSLATAWNIPAVGINHLEGHLLAPMLEDVPPNFPFVALLVSGGHTMLVDVASKGQYQILGQSLDDAAGEAFDKTAKLLGLGYPGGPAIAAAAKRGNADRFNFPRPMINHPNLDFSFSGLKTFARTTIQHTTLDEQTIADIALAFETAVVDTLGLKCMRALQQTGRKRLILTGGVGANIRLRKYLKALSTRQGVDIYYPRFEFCTDNGAMIAYAGYFRIHHYGINNLDDYSCDVRPRWSLEDI